MAVIRSAFGEAIEVIRAYIADSERGAADQKRHDDSDLYAQWAMAIAAAILAFLTLLQLGIGIATLVYLKWTFGENRRTADAAVDAAKAAQVSAKAAEDADKRAIYLERPNVFCSRLDFVRYSDGGKRDLPCFRIGLTNYGRSPAIMRQFNMTIELHGDNPVKNHWTVPLSNVIQPNAEKEFAGITLADAEKLSMAQWDEIHAQKRVLTVDITMTYYDVHGVGNVQGFNFFYDSRQQMFLYLDKKI